MAQIYETARRMPWPQFLVRWQLTINTAFGSGSITSGSLALAMLMMTALIRPLFPQKVLPWRRESSHA